MKTLNRRITTTKIRLPKKIFDRSPGTYRGEGYRLTIKADVSFLWFSGLAYPDADEHYYQLYPVPGNSPVSCCATEWDEVNSEPFYTDGKSVDILSIQRQAEKVRVKIKTSGDVPVIGIGVIFET